MKRRQFNRRFVGLVTAAASIPLLSRCARSNNAPDLGNPLQRLTSQDGLLELSLTAKAQTQKIANQSIQRLAYNGQFPGRILEARTGDTVRLTLVNELDSPTNLHYHGLHISPEIDNVFREVPSGEQYTYEFQIPENHPAITGWYHPHYHSKAALQVFGGLAGPLIIRGELDNIPEVQEAEEALLLLQDVDPRVQADSESLPTLAKRWGREGNLLLANGQQNPVIDLPQNGLLRLRLVNASASRIYRLQLQEHPWYLMATDRGAISEPIELKTLSLSPGERAELLISGQREPGDYEILSLPYDRGVGDMVEGMGEAAEQMPGIALPEIRAIATIRYVPSDRSKPLPLPKQLIPVEPLPKPETVREFVLDHGIDRSAKVTGFTINGESFVMDRVNTQVRLNQTEDWRIINKASMDHPFHLHTNRFQVVERNGQPEPFLAWKDTVSIGSYETVTIRVRFKDYTGRSVYHCHILDHEDQGMMGIVEIS
ncbi:MAG: multicopper oxidase family protein [Phormidesmis sp.]